MKRLLIIVLLLSAVSCGQKDPAPGGEPVRIIFDTDLGNDIDDVLALQMLLNYEKEGRAELLGITLCKANPATIAFTDGYCRFDGRGDIPLGYAYDGVTPEDGTYLLPTLEASFGGRTSAATGPHHRQRAARRVQTAAATACGPARRIGRAGRPWDR